MIGSNQFIYPLAPQDREYYEIKQPNPLTCLLTVKPRYTSNTLVLSFNRKDDGLTLKVEDFKMRDHRGKFTCNIRYKGNLLLAEVRERHIGKEIVLADSAGRSVLPDLMATPSQTAHVEKLADWIKPVHSLSDLKVGLISTQMGGACGLAVYAEELGEELGKIVPLKIFGIPVFGIERRGRKHYERLYNEVVEAKLNLVHILQHAGTFRIFSDLSEFTRRLRSIGIKVVISATSPYLTTVKADASHMSAIADLTLLHTQREVDFFKDNAHGRIAVLQHGIKLVPNETKSDAREKNGVAGSPVVATHGLFAPTYKGIDDLVLATAILKKTYPNIRLLLICSADRYPIQQVETELQIKHLKLRKNVTVFSDFLPTDQVYSLLHCADVIVFPYVGQFKDISGAFRKGLAAQRPVIVSDAPCFDPEFQLIKAPQKNPERLAEAIKDIYERPDKAEAYVKFCATYIQDLSWKKISEKLAGLYLKLWS